MIPPKLLSMFNELWMQLIARKFRSSSLFWNYTFQNAHFVLTYETGLYFVLETEAEHSVCDAGTSDERGKIDCSIPKIWEQANNRNLLGFKGLVQPIGCLCLRHGATNIYTLNLSLFFEWRKSRHLFINICCVHQKVLYVSMHLFSNSIKKNYKNQWSCFSQLNQVILNHMFQTDQKNLEEFGGHLCRTAVHIWIMKSTMKFFNKLCILQYTFSAELDCQWRVKQHDVWLGLNLGYIIHTTV